MNLRNYGWLFGTTLLVGGIGAVISSFVIAREQLFSSTIGNFFVVLLMNVLAGLAISALTQLGFFAYMMLNYLAISLFKNASLWKNVQVLLILVTFFDLVYLRVGSTRGDSIWPYLVEPIALLFIAAATAYGKVKLTNKSAWIPTIFFVFVVSTIEWFPVLEQNAGSIIFMAIPLLFCNIWQVMHLHRLVKKES